MAYPADHFVTAARPPKTGEPSPRTPFQQRGAPVPQTNGDAPKRWISVDVRVATDGRTLPLTIHWPDGRSFPIDRVLDVRQAASLKAGGCGMRYICRVRTKEVSLFCENGRWFMA